MYIWLAWRHPYTFWRIWGHSFYFRSDRVYFLSMKSCNTEEVQVQTNNQRNFMGWTVKDLFGHMCWKYPNWFTVPITSSNGNIFRVTGHLCGPVNSPHKGQWRGALMFSLICVWIHGWVINREAGDLRRYRTHYDVIVMVNTIFHKWTPNEPTNLSICFCLV